MKLLLTVHEPIDPKEWVKTQIAQSQDSLDKYGDVIPVMMFLAPNPEDPSTIIQGALDVSACFETEQSKELMVTLVKGILRAYRAFEMMLISEAWLCHFPKEMRHDQACAAVAEAGGIENLPDRTEVLMVLIETASSHEMQAWSIQRDQDNKPSLGDAVEMSSSEVGGRSSGFMYVQPEPDMLH